MKKLTLSIRDQKKVEWAKSFAKEHQTNVSRLFEDYISALMAFDQMEVTLSDTLQSLQQPGRRPNASQIENHLTHRRHRSTPTKQSE